MTNQQILEKAIQKAIDGGWLTTLCSTHTEWSVESDGSSGIGDLWIERTLAGHKMYRTFPEQYIYNHDFAKALWGEATQYLAHNEQVEEELSTWQYHLQQMVVAEDPIKYLGEHI